MSRQDGFTLLEVLLAMGIFAAVAMTLLSSMQGQLNAMAHMRNTTFALWVADNQLKIPSHESTGKPALMEQTFAGLSWRWRSEHSESEHPQLTLQTVIVTLPGGQQTSLTRYSWLPGTQLHE